MVENLTDAQQLLLETYIADIADFPSEEWAHDVIEFLRSVTSFTAEDQGPQERIDKIYQAVRTQFSRYNLPIPKPLTPDQLDLITAEIRFHGKDDPRSAYTALRQANKDINLLPSYNKKKNPGSPIIGVHVLTLRGDPVDSENVKELETHSGLLTRDRYIDLSSSNSPGMETIEQEKKAIASASVIGIMVSPECIANERIASLLEYAQVEGKTIGLIMSQPTDVAGTPLAGLPLLHEGKALSEMSPAEREAAFGTSRNPDGLENGILRELYKMSVEGKKWVERIKGPLNPLREKGR